MSDSNDNHDGMDDLHDARLRRALDHAPDRDAMPAPHTREAILKVAHNFAAASAPAAQAGRATGAAPWWRRLLGGDGPRSRMPWNAAFATVLVATFVTVLWHREPVPDARLDGEAQVTGAPASAPPMPVPAPSAEAPAVEPAPIVSSAPSASSALPPAATADMASPTARRSEAARDAKESPKSREAAEAREASRRREAPAAAASQKAQRDEERMLERAAPVPAPAPTAPAIAAAPAPAAPPMADVGQSPMPYAAAPPAPAVAPTPAPAAAPAAPMQRESAESVASSAAQGGANANVAGMQRRAAPVQAAPAAPVPALTAPQAAGKAALRAPATAGGFVALDRWTTLDITRAGTTTHQARGDTEGLAALVNTVARAATVSGGELAAPIEARIELRRDGALLAVLEIAGDQVRWTPQPGGPAFVGTPPAQALEALRTALSRTR